MTRESPTARCCANCYHYGYFIGHDGLTCEHTGRHKRRPYNYTNCKRFGFMDPIANTKVDENGGRLKDDEGCML